MLDYLSAPSSLCSLSPFTCGRQEAPIRTEQECAELPLFRVIPTGTTRISATRSPRPIVEVRKLRASKRQLLTCPPWTSTCCVRKIEAALKRRAEVEAIGVDVIVQNGNKVVLEGKVENWDERRAAEAAAWSAPGVTAVVDNLRIGQ